MKKLLPILFLLGAAALIFQIFVQFFMRHHEIDYSIITKDNSDGIYKMTSEYVTKIGTQCKK